MGYTTFMEGQVDDKYLRKLRQELLSCLANEPVKIYLFGSRARGEARTASDIDIGLIPTAPLRPGTLSMLRERVENLNIPYKVEIVNLLATSEEFRRHALEDARIWKS